MKANKNKNGQIIVGIPQEWYRKDTPDQLTEGYDKHFTEEDYIYDGWVDYTPAVIGENQRRGGRKEILDESGKLIGVTDHVIDKTIEEIQAEKLSLSASNREQKIKEASDAMIVTELMNETDIETVLGNLDIYPMWETGLHVINKADSPNGIPDRFKAFNADNELTLYEVVLSHTTQADWQPKDTPAMFKVVAPDGVIPVFKKPTGAHDAYQKDDKVHFPTESDPVYKSKIDGNTYSPIEYPQGWEIVL